MTSTILGIIFSVICDIFIVGCLVLSYEKLCDKLERFDLDAERNHQRIEQQSKELLKQAKEGTIWILRDDIIKSLEYHEATKVISQKQYKRLKDEYEYYTSIGGNHDVKDRWDNFNAKLYGLGEIKMVSELPFTGENK